jgi:hypothetical protein
MTLYNRYGTQLSIPEKPNTRKSKPLQIYLWGSKFFIKKLTGLKKDTPILGLDPREAPSKKALWFGEAKRSHEAGN